MLQVQGSTELMSHPPNTPYSSLILLFIDIKAATAQKLQDEQSI